MAGTLVGNADDGGRSNEYLTHFSSGQDNARYREMSKHERDLVRFTGRKFNSQIDRDHAIEQKFGYDALTYFRKLEGISEHPGLSPKMRDRLGEMYNAPTPGPQKGGAPIYAGNQFTHGTMW